MGQLTSYAKAVIAATGAPIVGVYVHMPLRGEVYQVTSLFGLSDEGATVEPG